MDDRDRRAPVALAADAPVAQAPGGAPLAGVVRGQRAGDGGDGGVVVQAAVVVGVDRHRALAALVLEGVPVLPAVVAEVGLVVDRDDLQDRDVVLLREREVALVVRRHAHHRAVAVAHEDVVGDPHLDRLVGQRVGDEEAGGQALLVVALRLALRRLDLAGAALGLLARPAPDRLGERRVAGGRVARQRMLGRDGAERHAHDRVGARGEDEQLAVLDRPSVGAADVVQEGEAHAVALADPVLLHRLDALGPAGQAGAHGRQQLVGVLRDLQVVAGDLALLDRRARAPAAAVDDLLVGEHGLVDRVPVDDLRAPLGDAGFEHLQEQPLVPAVVLGPAGGDLAAPVDGQPERLHLRLHVRDVVVGPLRRRHAVLHGRVLGRQPEGVPAHRHQHVHALHAQLAREHVVDGVVAHVPHVQLAAGVGQHRAGVVLLRLRRRLADAPGVDPLPVRLRLAFHRPRVVGRVDHFLLRLGGAHCRPAGGPAQGGALAPGRGGDYRKRCVGEASPPPARPAGPQGPKQVAGPVPQRGAADASGASVTKAMRVRPAFCRRPISAATSP